MSTDEMHTAIQQRLDRVEDKLDQIVEAVTRQGAVGDAARERLDAVCQTLYGNGHDGLLTRVDRLETMRRLTAQVAAGVIGLLSGLSVSLLGWLLEK